MKSIKLKLVSEKVYTVFLRYVLTIDLTLDTKQFYKTLYSKN